MLVSVSCRDPPTRPPLAKPPPERFPQREKGAIGERQRIDEIRQVLASRAVLPASSSRFPSNFGGIRRSPMRIG